MIVKNRAATLVILSAVAFGLFLPHSARGQEAEEQPSVRELMEQLAQADSYRRGALIDRMVERGENAVPELTDVVENWRAQPDIGYVTACMLALARMGEAARPATDALKEALNAPSSQIRYAAARALGNAWSGSGEATDQVRQLNAALLANTYSAAFTRRGAEAYGPVLALIQINRISIDKGGKPTVTSVPLQALRQQVGRWMARNPDALPAVEDQPWELLFARLLRQPRSDAGQNAKDLLIRRKALEAIRAITRTLGSDRVRVGTTRWQELADLLTGISGVEMPRDSDMAGYELVADWSDRWLEALQGRAGEKYRAYSIERFERAISEAKDDPRPEVLNQVEQIKTVLLHQLKSPDQLPENISPEARDLLEKPLAIKGQFATAVKAFAEDEQAHRRLQSVKRMQRLVSENEGPRVARQFLDQLVDFSRKEERRQILVALARLLRNSTGVPIVFGELSRDERNQRLDAWVEQVNRQLENREKAEE